METGSLRISDIRPDFYLYEWKQAEKAPAGIIPNLGCFVCKRIGYRFFPDMSKSLPAVDPDNRELFISLGCATENLCIAAEAKGYAPLPVFFRIGGDHRALVGGIDD